MLFFHGVGAEAFGMVLHSCTLQMLTSRQQVVGVLVQANAHAHAHEHVCVVALVFLRAFLCAVVLLVLRLCVFGRAGRQAGGQVVVWLCVPQKIGFLLVLSRHPAGQSQFLSVPCNGT